MMQRAGQRALFFDLIEEVFIAHDALSCNFSFMSLGHQLMFIGRCESMSPRVEVPLGF